MSAKASFSRRKEWMLTIGGIIVLFLPILLQWNRVAFYRGAKYSDLLIAHLPNAKFIQYSLGQWGQIPLWNPTIFSGAPFAADPLSGMAYLPNWLGVAFPFPLTFNLLLLIHLCWAALGCYFLARQFSLSQSAGIVFGLAFAGAPKFFSHLGLGHVSLIFSVTWTPWLLICVGRAIERIRQDRIRTALIGGGILGMIFLADPRWAIPGLLLAGAYALYTWLQLSKDRRGNRIQIIKVMLAFSGTSIGIAMVLAWPLWEYLQRSTRLQLTQEMGNILALEWSHILGLFHPIRAQAEQVLYLGVIVMLLALLGFMSRRRGTGFWGVIFVGSLLLSFGEETPLYPLLIRLLPGANFLRVPARMLFMTALAAGALAGYGLEWLLQPSGNPAQARRMRLSYLVFLTAVILVNFGLGYLGIGRVVDQILVSLLALAALVLLEYCLRKRTQASTLGRLWMILIVTELAWINWSLIRMEPYPAHERAREILNDNVRGGYGEARIFSPSYALSLNAAVDGKYELADGINPLQLSSYYDYLQRATGFSSQGYTVTLPPFVNGDPKQPWPLEIDQERIGTLNISHIVSDFPLEADSAVFVDQINGIYLYEIKDHHPRAWMETDDDSWLPAEIEEWTPNQIRVRAPGPGLLVLSELSYPGWQVSVDGRQANMLTHDGLFRAVEISQGEHQVKFTFYPRSVYGGSIIFALSLMIAFVLGWKR